MCFILHFRKQTSIVGPSICHPILRNSEGSEHNVSNSRCNCEKIVINLFATDENSEDQLVPITIFVNWKIPYPGKTIRGMEFEWISCSPVYSKLNPVLGYVRHSKDKLLFASSMSTYLFPLRWQHPNIFYWNSLNLSHSLQIDQIQLPPYIPRLEL